MSKKRHKSDPYASFGRYAAAPASQPRGGGNRRMFLIGAAGGLIALGGGVAWLAQPAARVAAVNLDADIVSLDKTAIDLGRVALNVVVPVVVRLTNQSRRLVSLGTPTIETLEGC